MNIVLPSEIPKVIESTPTDLIELYKVCMAMKEICEKEKGLGLSAVQCGIPWRVFLVSEANKYSFFVDCEYKPASINLITSIEGCLSLKDSLGKIKTYKLNRWEKIVVKGKSFDVESLVLKDVDFSPEGVYNIVFQHEIDHQRLVLISDIGEEIEVW